MTTLLAYHNDPAIKTKYLNRMRKHREADELLQSYGYWDDGRGCAVGCAVHSDANPHAKYEAKLGIPERIAHLEDAIFEGLPNDLAKQWPERFLSAIQPGANLSRVWHQFAAWMLSAEAGLITITDVNRAAIEQVAALHRRAAGGEVVADVEWLGAARSAESAQSAWAAALSAQSAESAESSAWQKMADKLVELLQSAPVVAGRE